MIEGVFSKFGERPLIGALAEVIAGLTVAVVVFAGEIVDELPVSVLL